MTEPLSRNQNPPSGGTTERRRTRPVSTRVPSTASRAGRATTAETTARAVVAMPAYAKERRKYCGNTSSAERDTATVRPEKITVRPAVRTLLTTAS